MEFNAVCAVWIDGFICNTAIYENNLIDSTVPDAHIQSPSLWFTKQCGYAAELELERANGIALLLLNTWHLVVNISGLYTGLQIYEPHLAH